MGTKSRRLSKVERTVLEYIHHLGLEHKDVFFSQDILAKKMGKSREWTNKVLRRLKAKGFLTFSTTRIRYKRRDEAGRTYYIFKNKVNTYVLNPLWKLVYERSGLKEVVTSLAGFNDYLKRLANLNRLYLVQAWFKQGFSKKFTQYQCRIYKDTRVNKLTTNTSEKAKTGMLKSVSTETPVSRAHLLSLLHTKPPQEEQEALKRDMNQQELVQQRIAQLRQERDRKTAEQEELRHRTALEFISIRI